MGGQPWPDTDLVIQPDAAASEDPGADIDVYGWADFSTAALVALPSSLGVDDRLYAVSRCDTAGCEPVAYLYVAGLGGTLRWYQANGFTEDTITLGADEHLWLSPSTETGTLPAITQPLL